MGTPSAMVAVDVGNSRIKLAWFDSIRGSGWPEPTRTLTLTGRRPELDRLGEWLSQGKGKESAGSEPASSPPPAWWIGSVNRPAATRLLNWLRDLAPFPGVVLLTSGDLPLSVGLQRPDMVGIDRLLDAVAANHLRAPDRPAVVVDIGSAVTVDLVSADGVFLGGAIAPGLAMAARAMHEFTDLLPQLDMADLAEPPAALGQATVPAMRSGLFWGTVGTIRELAARLAEQAGGEPDVFLTGGAGPAVARLLGGHVRHIPNLTLGGIALAARGSFSEPRRPENGDR